MTWFGGIASVLYLLLGNWPQSFFVFSSGVHWEDAEPLHDTSWVSMTQSCQVSSSSTAEISDAASYILDFSLILQAVKSHGGDSDH